MPANRMLANPLLANPIHGICLLTKHFGRAPLLATDVEAILAQTSPLPGIAIKPQER